MLSIALNVASTMPRRAPRRAFAAVLADHDARERLLAGLGVRRERDQLVVLDSGVTASSESSAWMSSSKISRFLSASSLKRAKARSALLGASVMPSSCSRLLKRCGPTACRA
jgi:hypothetical protein